MQHEIFLWCWKKKSIFGKLQFAAGGFPFDVKNLFRRLKSARPQNSLGSDINCVLPIQVRFTFSKDTEKHKRIFAYYHHLIWVLPRRVLLFKFPFFTASKSKKQLQKRLGCCSYFCQKSTQKLQQLKISTHIRHFKHKMEFSCAKLNFLVENKTFLHNMEVSW